MVVGVVLMLVSTTPWLVNRDFAGRGMRFSAVNRLPKCQGVVELCSVENILPMRDTSSAVCRVAHVEPLPGG
jgi:hypothetical protein